jgi:hypothetical protein
MTLNLAWTKCQGNVWGSLINIDLKHPYLDAIEGVYIIWHGGKNPEVVRVGQGVVRDRLNVQRKNKDILQYKSSGPLRVTWASVDARYRDGVEKYLTEKLEPLIEDRTLTVSPIEVNLPYQGIAKQN